MIKLSDRLNLIFNLIEQEETMADIGTDHGFLPIALWESGKSSKIILTDINDGPLQKALENIHKEKSSIPLDLRQGNGLGPLLPGEVDTIVIAGMGGVLITDILGEDLEKTKSFKKIILQPRNGQEKLRRWIADQHFKIVKEELVRENKNICEIILVTSSLASKPLFPGDEKPDIYYEIPNLDLVQNRTLLKQFIEKKIRVEQKIEERILHSGNKDSESNRLKMEKVKGRIHFLEEYLKKLEMRDGDEI